MSEAKAEQQFVCGYVIEFRDGGEPEAEVLHVGSLEDCEKVSSLIPGVAYSGDRPVEGARIVIRELRGN